MFKNYIMLQRLLIIFLLVVTQVYNAKSAEAFYPEPVFFTQEKEYFLHTVERGQTVYSISKMYSISVSDIYALNPGSEAGIKIGSQLKIPQLSGSYLYHTIQPKETLYSVSRMYQMKGEDIVDVNPGLSIETFTAGNTIRIPTNRVTTPMTGPTEEYVQTVTNALLYPSNKTKNLKTVQVALLLPFTSGSRMVEYYEGFLLALSDIKKKGISVDLQVYDTGSGADLLPEVLKNPALKKANVIIGGLSDAQIKLIAEFSDRNKIPYVIPFTSKSDELLSYYTVYQINTPQSYLYSKASAAFCKKYKGSNIIFYTPRSQGNRMDFIQTVQKDLTAKNISYQVIDSESLSYGDLLPYIDSDKNNVFVPSDDGTGMLSKLLASIRTLTEMKPQLSVSLFGYPSWQLHSLKYMNDFFRLNATFYSIFYANPTSAKVKSFRNSYVHWYSKELINSYPKYGMLGYDTGMFFIQLLNKYGTSYDANINKLTYSGVQTDFYFERVNNWGGFINTNLYLVEFNSNNTIVSNQIK
jgi:LysM repeat protein